MGRILDKIFAESHIYATSIKNNGFRFIEAYIHGDKTIKIMLLY